MPKYVGNILQQIWRDKTQKLYNFGNCIINYKEWFEKKFERTNKKEW